MKSESKYIHLVKIIILFVNFIFILAGCAGRTPLVPLVDASRKGNIEEVKALLSKGANVNDLRKRGDMALGDTALIEASKHGHMEIVKLLLKEGADVNTSGEFGRYTALKAACEHGHIEIVKLLLKEGADVNAYNERWDSTLIATSRNGHIEIVKLLLKEGADVNAYNEGDDTALIAASRSGHIEIVKLLLKEGAYVNSRGSLGETALIAAYSRLDIVKLLLNNGANLNDVDNYGKTVMAKACFINQKGRYPELVEFLKAQGAEEVRILTLGELESIIGMTISVFKQDCSGDKTFKTPKGTFEFSGCSLYKWNSPYLDQYITNQKINIYGFIPIGKRNYKGQIIR